MYNIFVITTLFALGSSKKLFYNLLFCLAPPAPTPITVGNQFAGFDIRVTEKAAAIDAAAVISITELYYKLSMLENKRHYIHTHSQLRPLSINSGKLFKDFMEQGEPTEPTEPTV
jgi:hypothetical protein